MAPTIFKRSCNNIFVTIVICLTAIQISDGSVNPNQNSAISGSIPDPDVNYTEFSDDANYTSDQFYNPEGMSGFYKLTRDFLEALVPDQFDVTKYLKIENNDIVFTWDINDSWQDYKGLLAFTIILLVITFLIPIIGIIFCICRCYGNCGSKAAPSDEKSDWCSKIILATLLICFGGLLLFGMVCSFASSQDLQDGVEELPRNLNRSVKDLGTYLDVINEQIKTLLDVNAEQFQGGLEQTINTSSVIITDKVSLYLNESLLNDLLSLIDNLPTVDNLEQLKSSIDDLRIWAPQVNDAFKKMQIDLKDITSNIPGGCDNIPACTATEDIVNNLDSNINVNGLPDLSQNIDTLNNLQGSIAGIKSDISTGITELSKIKTDISTTINDTVRESLNALEDARDKIKTGSNNITSIIKDLKSTIDDNTDSTLNSAQGYIDDYYDYIYAAVIIICCILLVIVFCITMGLIFGICGKRPKSYKKSCSNKSTGSSFLICAVMIMFIISAILGILIVIASAFGLVGEMIICNTLRNPDDSKIFELLNQLNLSEYHVNTNLSDILKSCHQDQSIYQILQLDDQFNLDDLNATDMGNIDEIFDQLNISQYIPPDLILLTNMDGIKVLGRDVFGNIDFNEFKTELEPIQDINLLDLSTKLQEFIEELNKLNADGRFDSVIAKLKTNEEMIDVYQEKLIEPTVAKIPSIIDLITNITNQLQLQDDGSFADKIDEITNSIETAQNNLKTVGVEDFKNLTIDLAKVIENQIYTFIDRLYAKTKNDVGRCGPLSLAFNATLTSTCDKVLQPFNGYWFGLFWSVILFLPLIVVSVMLAALYQKYRLDSEHGAQDSRNGRKMKKDKKNRRYEDTPRVPAYSDYNDRAYQNAGSGQNGATAPPRYNNDDYTSTRF